MPQGIRMLRYLSGSPVGILLFLVVCGACSSMNMIPDIPIVNESPSLAMTGRIEYDGKREYLPRVIVSVPSSQSEQAVRYVTTETQERSGWDLLALFNPLSLIGSPTGSLTSTVTGRLDIVNGSGIVRSYAATCVQKSYKGIYYGDTFSDLRKAGMLAVRNNIEAQVEQDREYLRTVISLKK